MEEQKVLLGRFDALRELIKKEDQDIILKAYNLITQSKLQSYAQCDNEILLAHYTSIRDGNYDKLESVCKILEDIITLKSRVRVNYYNTLDFALWFR